MWRHEEWMEKLLTMLNYLDAHYIVMQIVDC